MRYMRTKLRQIPSNRQQIGGFGKRRFGIDTVGSVGRFWLSLRKSVRGSDTIFRRFDWVTEVDSETGLFEVNATDLKGSGNRKLMLLKK